MVRKVPKSAFENVSSLASYLNSFVHLDFFFVPAEIEESGDHFVVKYLFVPSRKANLGELRDNDEFVRRLILLSRSVLASLCPPIRYFSSDDVFIVGDELFFVPPLPLDVGSLQSPSSDERSGACFINPQPDRLGTLKFLARIVDTYDLEQKYRTITQIMNSGFSSIQDIDRELYGEKFCSALRVLKRKLDENIGEAVGLRGKVFKVRLAPLNRMVSDLLFAEIFSELNGKFVLFNVKNDFTNIIRQLVAAYYDKLPNDVREPLAKCLYASCRFDTVLLDVLEALLSLGRDIVLFVDDLENADFFIKVFVKKLELLASNGFTVVVVSTEVNNPHFELSETVPEEVLQTLSEIEIRPLTLETEGTHENFASELLAGLALVGKSGLLLELQKLARHYGEEGTKALGELLNRKLVHIRGARYELDGKAHERVLSNMDDRAKASLCAKLTSVFGTTDGRFGSAILTSAKLLEEAEQLASAASLYLRFIRHNLDTYSSSPTRLREIFQKLYEILKKIGRTESYSFRRLWLQYRYQTLDEVLEEFNDEFKDDDPLLSCLYHFVNNNFRECEKFRDVALDGKQSVFKRAQLLLLVARAEYNLTDRISEECERELTALFNQLPNRKGTFSVKAEIALLLSYAKVYYDKRIALSYLKHAEHLINACNALHLRITFLNLLGIAHDSELISTVFLREAVETARAIGYAKRLYDPLVNYLRAVLYFGMLEIFKNLSERAIKLIPSDEEVTPAQKAFLLRIAGFLHTYQQEYELGMRLFSKSLALEAENGLQRSTLRSLVLHELMCGHIENAKRVLQENRDDPALRTRALEYLAELVLAEDADTFRKTWEEYKNSKVYLLREEILYLFADKLVEVDEQGFLSEVNKWEMLYSLERTKLSLFYVLLAKQRYYQLKGNDLKRYLTLARIVRLAEEMKISHPFIKEAVEYLTRVAGGVSSSSILTSFLEVLHSVDSRLSLEQLVKLYASLILEFFNARKVYIRVCDEQTSLNVEYGTLTKLERSGTTVNASPLTVSLSGSIDEKSRYELYFSSEESFRQSQEELEGAVAMVEEIFAENVAAILLRERASRDPLTGLFNRWKINDVLGEFMREFRLSGRNFSIFVIDIDGFKKINDSYGHTKGDQVLKWLAKVLESEVGKEAIVGRFGGEEFIGIIPAEKAKAFEVCERLRAVVESNSEDAIGFRVTFSAGVACAIERGTLTELIGLADQRLYVAKASGKNRVIVE